MDNGALRTQYREARLDERTVLPDPFEQFKRWFKEAQAADVLEAYAMTLASVGGDGRPSARTVLMKTLDRRGFVFYSSGSSRKVGELREGNLVSLLFFWRELERQVRIEGAIERVSNTGADTYFSVRPRLSQIAAWAFVQSQPVADRGTLVKAFGEAQTRFDDVEKIPRPPQWGGYRVLPVSIEFWQGRTSRLHDRIVYCKEVSPNVTAPWRITRLAP